MLPAYRNDILQHPGQLPLQVGVGWGRGRRRRQQINRHSGIDTAAAVAAAAAAQQLGEQVALAGQLAAEWQTALGTDNFAPM